MPKLRPLSLLLAGPALVAHAPGLPPAAGALAPWVQRSNANTRLLLEVQARFAPESAGRMGVDGLDEQILDLKPGYNERRRRATEAAIVELRKRRTAETDAAVRQDLDILIAAAEEALEGQALSERLEVEYFNLPQTIFGGLRSLLDDQISEARRAASVVRLRRYVGAEAGYTPLVDLAMARTREDLRRPGLAGPSREEVENDLDRAQAFLEGLEKLFRTYQLKDWEAPFATLKAQLEAYQAFVRKEVLPRARKDFRLQPELYAFSLKSFGVDLPPDRLAAKAHAAFKEIQSQMQVQAAQVAATRHLKDPDYRAVIRALKQEQLPNEALLAHYQGRLKDMETIIQREHLLTLPDRPARIRLASEAESAQQPAPNMRPPRLVGNQGEQGEFVLPLNLPAKPGEAAKRYDDFSFAAGSWTLTAHEARPGHELQYASIVEKGVSTARAIYAFNSTNVEGWGLYAEAITQPFMPAEGQLICLQHRLLRAARAFLDPELQAGRIQPGEAKRILMEDVQLSDAMATQEVERYTFRMPGQATSYFYGYSRLLELRQEVEGRLGKAFNAQRFHDFILSQGLLPPELLRQAVLAAFVKPASAAGR